MGINLVQTDFSFSMTLIKTIALKQKLGLMIIYSKIPHLYL